MKATTSALSLLAAGPLMVTAGAQKSGNNPPVPDEQVWKDLRGKITHVVYLMLENHSFDNIAGYWNFRDDINGLRNITFCNDYSNPNWTIYGEPIQICASEFESEVPLRDPDHSLSGTSYELYEKWNPTVDDVPTMGGFVERQSEQYEATPGNSSFVIKAYNQKKTQTLATMAQEFAFFDNYFSAVPGPTNPNRQFATSGSSCGMVDNSKQSSGWFANVTGTDCAVSIFESLTNANISWKNYYETDIIDSYMYQWVQQNAMDKLVHASEFYDDLKNGTLPTFSYINPECCSIDSMHPTSNMAAGMSMVKHLYDSLRASRYWNSTLLIINFDEAGGFADHVPPPVKVPAPDDGITFSGMNSGHNVTFNFDRLGLRVPAFLISPWIPRDTLIHNDGTSYSTGSQTESQYSHTSILNFLRNLWQLEGFNNRVTWSKTFEHIFADEMRTDALEKLPAPIWEGGSNTPSPAKFYKLNQDAGYYNSL